MSRENQICQCRNRRQPSKFVSTLLVCLSPALALSAFAQTNSYPAPVAPVGLPDDGVSAFFRMLGALALVIGLFLGGVWFFRNWQRIGLQRGQRPKLNIVETRSLGGRHAIHVIGYENERFLVASSPSGVNLLSHLPAATESSAETEAKNPAPPSFAQALSQVLKGK